MEHVCISTTDCQPQAPVGREELVTHSEITDTQLWWMSSMIEFLFLEDIPVAAVPELRFIITHLVPTLGPKYQTCPGPTMILLLVLSNRRMMRDGWSFRDLIQYIFTTGTLTPGLDGIISLILQ